MKNGSEVIQRELASLAFLSFDIAGRNTFVSRNAFDSSTRGGVFIQKELANVGFLALMLLYL